MSTNPDPKEEPVVSITTRIKQADRTSPITQQRLKRFYEMQMEYEEAKREFLALEANFRKEEEALALRSIAGAPVATGLYRPIFRLIKIRHPRYKDALIQAKGEKYQQGVLEGTKPSIHFYGRVE